MVTIGSNVRNVCVICLMVFSLQSCINWTWEADPYEPSVEYKDVMNADGESVSFDDPAFEKFTCFDEDNMAELIINIKKLKLKKKKDKRSQSRLIDKLTR